MKTVETLDEVRDWLSRRPRKGQSVGVTTPLADRIRTALFSTSSPDDVSLTVEHDALLMPPTILNVRCGDAHTIYWLQDPDWLRVALDIAESIDGDLPVNGRLILLLDCQPSAHAFIDRCGWTFWFCHGCNHIDHFERSLSREQLDRYTRGHRLFCAEDAGETGAQHV